MISCNKKKLKVIRVCDNIEEGKFGRFFEGVIFCDELWYMSRSYLDGEGIMDSWSRGKSLREYEILFFL